MHASAMKRDTPRSGLNSGRLASPSRTASTGLSTVAILVTCGSNAGLDCGMVAMNPSLSTSSTESVMLASRQSTPRVLCAVLVSTFATPALVAGCVPGDPYSRMWIEDNSGTVVLHYVTCGSERVTEVTVRAGNGGGQRTWRVMSTESSIHDFVLFRVPPGFTLETQPLDGAPAGPLDVSIRTTQRDTGDLLVKAADLVPGNVVWDRGVEPRQQFLRKHLKLLTGACN